MAVASATARLSNCSIREELASRLQALLGDFYVRTAAAVKLNGIGVVSEETEDSYNACLAARLALEEHERDHACR